MKKDILKKVKIPDNSGVYFFLKEGKILYIGKATSLRERLNSYMSKRLFDMRGPIIADLTSKADKINWQETDSVLEALILEAELIKKHQPRYNTKEKSDKSFNYVCITRELLPRVLVLRGRNVKHPMFDKVYGPYTNGSQLREAMKIIRRIFPFLDDRSKNYYKFYKQVDLVPDISNVEGVQQYKNNIKNLKLFFAGRKKQVLKNLEKEMKTHAKIYQFEKAGEVKRQLFALKHINDVALIKDNFADNKIFDSAPFFGRIKGSKVGPSDTKISLSASLFRIEAYDIAHMGGKDMVGVMIVIGDGEIAKNEYRKFKIRTQSNANDTGALVEILERRLAHEEWALPNIIVVDGGIAQLNAAQAILSRLNISTPIVSVVKDDKHRPLGIKGDRKIIQRYEREILLANSEAHRFAITYHKKVRARSFLKQS